MDYDIIIAGGGIIGLSTAYTILNKEPDVKLCLIEKENGVSLHQTGNNSGVIHSGIYYKPGSLKAVNCIRGYGMLIDFCITNNIKYDICGKIIVATGEKELLPLKNLHERGIENGLNGLKMLSDNELKEYEPHVNGIQGIWVPQTGIIDYREVSKKFYELILSSGGEFRFNEELIEINIHNHTEIKTSKGSYRCRKLITCCGLHSDRVAKLTNKNLKLRIIPFRGEYYKIRKGREYLVKNLIYPVPDPQFPFLGVHYTRKINGETEAGPNAVFAFGREAYRKYQINIKDLWDSLSWKGFRKMAKQYWKMGSGEFYRSFYKPAFTRALQKLTPEIRKDDLEKGGSGVRAQACGSEGKLIDDFLFVENENVLHVCNAPSPAATSCLSIGETISGKILSNW